MLVAQDERCQELDQEVEDTSAGGRDQHDLETEFETDWHLDKKDILDKSLKLGVVTKSEHAYLLAQHQREMEMDMEVNAADEGVLLHTLGHASGGSPGSPQQQLRQRAWPGAGASAAAAASMASKTALARVRKTSISGIGALLPLIRKGLDPDPGERPDAMAFVHALRVLERKLGSPQPARRLPR